MEIPFVLLPLECGERVAACVCVERRRRKREAKIDRGLIGDVGAGTVNKLRYKSRALMMVETYQWRDISDVGRMQGII